MSEFTCARCGILVVLAVEERHPENIYCLGCRFIESLDGDAKTEAEAFFARIDRPAGED